MNESLQIGDIDLLNVDIIPLLAGYQMLPALLREMIIDEAIKNIECTQEEAANAMQLFCQKNQIGNESQLQAWLNFYGMTQVQFESSATRELRIEKFKQLTWGKKLESNFVSRKNQYDKVIYSLIRTDNLEIAQELFFRLQANEQSFADLAKQYSQGQEAQTGGLIGPVELSVPHPSLAKLLSTSKPGQVCPPLQIANWFVIVKLEKFIPCEFDEPMQKRLLNELFTNWVQEQLQNLRNNSNLNKKIDN